MKQPLWSTVWRFLKKLTVELPYDPAIPLLGIYPCLLYTSDAADESEGVEKREPSCTAGRNVN